MAIAYSASAQNIGPFGGRGTGASLIGVIVGTGAAGTLSIYNGQNASGQLLAVIDTAAANFYEFESLFNNGLFLVQTGTAKISIVYE